MQPLAITIFAVCLKCLFQAEEVVLSSASCSAVEIRNGLPEFPAPPPKEVVAPVVEHAPDASASLAGTTERVTATIKTAVSAAEILNGCAGVK